MSEFSEVDFKKWWLVSLKKNCSIRDAIYHDLFFRAKEDHGIIKRATYAFYNYYDLEIPVEK